MMTLDELIEKLTELKENGVDGECEVRLQTQPNYPFESNISGYGTKRAWETQM